MKCIYLDNNSTTALLPAAREAMLSASEAWGNPASAHQIGRRARRFLEDAREQVASLLGAHADEVIFTSGATEANNLALFGLAGSPPGLLVGSALEHPSVVEALASLGRAGFTLASLSVTPAGTVDLASLPAGTRLVALMRANHETGAVQPIPADVTWHCDAVQAVGKIPIDFHALGAASLALSAHKFHGPVGVGALLLRRGLTLRPMLFGGQQQQGRRPGTESAPLASGLAVALAHACKHLEAHLGHVRALRQRLLDRLAGEAFEINGPQDGLPHTLNLSFPGLQADSLLIALDLAGVACSAGSACSSGSLQPSAVLRAMGLPEERLRTAIRLSLSPLNTLEEIDVAGERLLRVTRRLREKTGVLDLLRTT